MQMKANFLSAITFNDYCNMLGTLDWENNSVYVITSKNILENLSVDIRNKIKYMGTLVFLPVDGKYNEDKYSLQFIDKETIKIDKKEISLYVDGINVVIFNRPNDVIISNVFFDIVQSDNPTTNRIIDGKYMEKQIGINKWQMYIK